MALGCGPSGKSRTFTPYDCGRVGVEIVRGSFPHSRVGRSVVRGKGRPAYPFHKGAADVHVVNLSLQPRQGLRGTRRLPLPVSFVLKKHKLCTDVRLMEKYPRDVVRDELWMNTTEMKDRIRQLRQLLWALCVIGLAGLIGSALWNGFGVGLRYSARPEKALEGLGNFGTVPDFSLLERSGISINLSDLQGKIWIVNFIYTSCPDTCPLQSAEMAKLQGELDHEATFRLLSITIDPERDTLQVLSRYADRFGADPDRWLFLTGEKEDIYRLAQQGFHLSAVPISNGERNDDTAFIHSSRFVLVDDKAQIRGYYISTDPDTLRRLRRDLKTLLTGNGQ